MITAKAKEPGKTKAEMPSGNKQPSAAPKSAVINPVWSQMALGAQAKLTIGQPDDQYEREADQVADQVMRMPEPRGSDDDKKVKLPPAEPEAYRLSPSKGLFVSR